MILHCDTPVHPLIHHGTQQRERLLKAIIPGQLVLDDRSIEELLAFAGAMAKHVRYWNSHDEDAGDWIAFWESDTTPLLALVAATDLDTCRIAFRSKELEYLRLKKREDQKLNKEGDVTSAQIINELVSDPSFGVYSMAEKVLEICRKIPASHPLKADIISIVETKLRKPLIRLIQFHKAVEQNAILKYAGFIGNSECASPWNLPDNAAFECIDYILPYEHREELWKLFLKFYQALSLIVDKAKKAFNASIRNRRDHHPHIALFVAFLHLFRYVQSDLNNLAEKHLLFYYQDVLHLQERRLIPDKVHLVFEIAQNLERYRIGEGTLFSGGTDAGGLPRLYSLEDELVASQVTLAEKKSVHFFDFLFKGIYHPLPVSAKRADKADGMRKDFAPGNKAWNPFSRADIVKDVFYKAGKLFALYGLDIEDLKERNAGGDLTDNRNKPGAELEERVAPLKYVFEGVVAPIGLIISSPELWLAKSRERTITITLENTGSWIGSNGEEQKLNQNSFDISISTAEGLLTVPRKPAPTISGDEITITINLDNRFPPVTPLEKENSIFNALPDHPFLLIAPSIELDETVGYDALRNIIITDITLRTSSVDIKNFGVQVGDTVYPSTAQIPLLGGSSLTPVNLYIRTEEINKKRFSTIEINESKKPESGNIYVDIENEPTEIEPRVSLRIAGDWKSEEEELRGYVPSYTALPEKYTSDVYDGFIRISGEIPEADGAVVRNYYVASESISITYLSEGVSFKDQHDDDDNPSYHRVFYLHPFGVAPAEGFDEQIYLIPRYAQPVLDKPEALASEQDPATMPEAVGNLFLGFEDLQPGQTLSLLFKTAEGTGNPDHFAPEVIWSYLKDNKWWQIPPQFILDDETLGMKQAGIIRFQVPADINNGNTWIMGEEGRTDLYWLRASVTEIPEDDVLLDALPMLVDIHINAATAVYQHNNNSPEHLTQGLPAQTIAALRFRDVNVKKVEQPYDSFGGRLSEAGHRMSYYRRIHERLRHKQRAVTIWDYERLILEAFPKVAVAKCLPHTRRFAAAMPGYVTIAVIPYPDKMIGYRKYYPSLDAGDLQAMRDYLMRLNSYFVGGYGDADFCCCEGDCHCHKKPARLTVINARFEPVRLKVCVRFSKGKDIPFYTKELNEALKSFLAPWGRDAEKPLLFGAAIHTTHLLQFLENLDYVDVVLSLKVKHFATRESADSSEDDIPWTDAETIVPFTAASLLTTYLDRLEEDFPNVIDHEINVVDDHDPCGCKDCQEEEEEQIASQMVNEATENLISTWNNTGDTNETIRAFETEYLDKLKDEGVIKHYEVEKIGPHKPGERIPQLRVRLVKPDELEETFLVNNPKLKK